jgi:hypothetical protein
MEVFKRSVINQNDLNRQFVLRFLFLTLEMMDNVFSNQGLG